MGAWYLEIFLFGAILLSKLTAHEDSSFGWKWLCELWLPWNLDSNWPGSYTDLKVLAWKDNPYGATQHLSTQRWTYGHHTLSWEPVPSNKMVLAGQRVFSILSGSVILSSSLIPNYLLLTFKIMLPLHVLDLCSAPGDQKRAPEPLEHMAVSWHVGAGNQNRVLCKNSQSSNHCAIFPAPSWYF